MNNEGLITSFVNSRPMPDLDEKYHVNSDMLKEHMFEYIIWGVIFSGFTFIFLVMQGGNQSLSLDFRVIASLLVGVALAAHLYVKNEFKN